MKRLSDIERVVDAIADFAMRYFLRNSRQSLLNALIEYLFFEDVTSLINLAIPVVVAG